MRNRRIICGNAVRALGLVAALGFASISASADVLQVTESGVWAAGTTTTLETVAGEPWSFSFDVDSNPVVLSTNSGCCFGAPFSDFTYTLNGAPLVSPPTGVEWYTIASGGLIDIFFSDGGYFQIEGAQAFSGTLNDPTILAGVYPVNGSSFFYDAAGDTSALTGDLVITDINPTPEPSSLLLLGSGLAGLGGLLRRKLNV